MMKSKCKQDLIRLIIIVFMAILFGRIDVRQFFDDERMLWLSYFFSLGFVGGFYDWWIKKMTTKKFLYNALALCAVLAVMLVVIYVFDLKDDLFFYVFFVVMIVVFCWLLLLDNESSSNQNTPSQNAPKDDKTIHE